MLERIKGIIRCALPKIKREDIVLSSEKTVGITRLSVFVGEDNIVCLPTGYGKSIEIYH